MHGSKGDSRDSIQFPEIECARVTLTELGQHGLADLYEYSRQRAVYRYLEFKPHRSLEDTRRYLEKLMARSRSETGHYWFIYHRADRKIIGTFGLQNIDWRKGCAEIGYGLSPAYWKQGYFQEALRGALKLLFHEFHFHRVWATTHSGNLASIRGLERAGFIREGTLREFYLCYQGRRHDAVLYSILRDEFENDGSKSIRS